MRNFLNVCTPQSRKLAHNNVKNIHSGQGNRRLWTSGCAYTNSATTSLHATPHTSWRYTKFKKHIVQKTIIITRSLDVTHRPCIGPASCTTRDSVWSTNEETRMRFVVGLKQVRIVFLGLAADAVTACCSPCCPSYELVSIPATGSSSGVDSFSFPGPTPRATESPHVLFKHFSLLFCSFSIDDSCDCTDKK